MRTQLEFKSDYAALDAATKGFSATREKQEPRPSQQADTTSPRPLHHYNVAPPVERPSTDFHPISGHTPHATFGKAGRFDATEPVPQLPPPNASRVGKGSLAPESISDVPGFQSWHSKKQQPPGGGNHSSSGAEQQLPVGSPAGSSICSPQPEEDAGSSQKVAKSRVTQQQQPLWKSQPLERRPNDPHVHAASMNTTARGEIWPRHMSPNAQTAAERLQEKRARQAAEAARAVAPRGQGRAPAGGKRGSSAGGVGAAPTQLKPATWSNVRWSREGGATLGHDASSHKVEARDLHGRTEKEKAAEREEIAEAERQAAVVRGPPPLLLPFRRAPGWPLPCVAWVVAVVPPAATLSPQRMAGCRWL